MKLSRRAWAASVIAAAVMALLAGGTYALAASGGTIRACAKKSGGALRIAATCKTNERRVTWNVRGLQGIQGPKGVTGPKGDTGPRGDTGPTGPSAAYTAVNDDDVNVSSGETTLAVLSLPAGNWVINAKAVAQDMSDTAIDVQCQLASERSVFDESIAGVDENSSDLSVATIPVQVARAFSTPTAVELQCDSDGVSAQSSYASITAIQVGTLSSS